MRIAVLAHPEDRPALRVYCRLAADYGEAQVGLVAADALTMAPIWHHRLEDDQTRSEVVLADGRVLDDCPDRVIFNRLRSVRAPHFARADPADRDYAQAELHALVLSWLAGLPGAVVNRASPSGLAGPELGDLHGLHLAAAAGLPVRRVGLVTNSRRVGRRAGHGRRLGPQAGRLRLEGCQPEARAAARGATLFEDDTGPDGEPALVVGDRVVGSLPPALHDAARCLAATLGCELLQLSLAGAGAALRVTRVSAHPDFSGPGQIEAAADWLARCAGLEAPP